MSCSSAPARLAVLISGNGSNLQALLDRIQSGQLNASITTVISNNPEAYGLKRAKAHDIPCQVIKAAPREARTDYDQRVAASIDEANVDYILLAGFMRILSDAFVERYMGRMLNIHPSLLPRYKGLHTHQRALDAGDTQHGASVHFVTPALDDGPVIMQAIVDIKTGDDSESLAQRVLQQEHELYTAAVQLCIDRRIQYQDGHIIYDRQPLTAPLILGAS